MSLILHCGGVPATRERVQAVSVPEYTATHCPVPYGDAISLLLDQARPTLGDPIREAHGLAREGQQLFSTFTFAAGDGHQMGYMLGLRQSYDKSLALSTCAGATVFVCDNLAFNGSSVVTSRKNTGNVLKDYTAQVVETLQQARARFRDMTLLRDKLLNKRIGTDGAYSVLGRMYGRGLMSSRHLATAVQEWDKPSHEEHGRGTGWTLYNACTEALKRGAPATTIQRIAGATDYIEAELVS